MMNRIYFRRLSTAFLLMTTLHLSGWAQQSSPNTAQQEERRRLEEERFHTDWANLKRYEAEN